MSPSSHESCFSCLPKRQSRSLHDAWLLLVWHRTIPYVVFLPHQTHHIHSSIIFAILPPSPSPSPSPQPCLVPSSSILTPPTLPMLPTLPLPPTLPILQTVDPFDPFHINPTVNASTPAAPPALINNIVPMNGSNTNQGSNTLASLSSNPSFHLFGTIALNTHTQTTQVPIMNNMNNGAMNGGIMNNSIMNGGTMTKQPDEWDESSHDVSEPTAWCVWNERRYAN